MSFHPSHNPPQLPHADTMHWLDAADRAADGTIRAQRTIRDNHPFTHDGQLQPSALIELIAQAAAAGAILKSTAAGKKLRRGLLAAIHQFDCNGPVRVGDTVTLTGREEKSFAGFVSASFEARVHHSLVARARMTFHLSFE